MADAGGFGKLVPGFDFLQELVKNAGAAMPHMGQWIAPTLDPEELDKRIDELKTVQFWLEQNARLLGATIQALEVQRMTLSTLKTMNVQMGDLRSAMTLRPPAPAPASPDATTAAAAPAEPTSAPEAAPPAPAAAGVVDPMQWWGALTKQFTDLASAAMKEGASGAAKNLAGVMAAAAPADAAPAATAGRRAAPRKTARSAPPATKTAARKSPTRRS